MENLKILLKKRKELDNKIYDILIDEVRKKARAILKNNTNLDEFTMAMGTYFFSNKGEIRHDYENKIFNSFMSKYDDEKLTGFAMTFKENGKEINHW